MKIETPVATLGIRGTTKSCREVAAINSNLGNVTYSSRWRMTTAPTGTVDTTSSIATAVCLLPYRKRDT